MRTRGLAGEACQKSPGELVRKAGSGSHPRESGICILVTLKVKLKLVAPGPAMICVGNKIGEQVLGVHPCGSYNLGQGRGGLPEELTRIKPHAGSMDWVRHGSKRGGGATFLHLFSCPLQFWMCPSPSPIEILRFLQGLTHGPSPPSSLP